MIFERETQALADPIAPMSHRAYCSYRCGASGIWPSAREFVITVVGGGATALALLAGLRGPLQRRQFPLPLRIYVVDLRGLHGRGLAFDRDSASNLLNTRAASISPFPDRPDAFVQWLAGNPDALRAHGVRLPFDSDGFMPRALFGQFLESAFAEQAMALALGGVSVSALTAEVTDIERLPNGRLLVHTDRRGSLESDHVVLSCGNLHSASFEQFEGHPGFFSSPYPVETLCRSVPRSAAVAVLGSRLAAVDTVVGLLSAGHTGPITLLSRSGYLPSVRGSQQPYELRVLTADAVTNCAEHNGGLTLECLLRLARQEIALASGSDGTRMEAFPSPPSNPIAFLANEIEAAAATRWWQVVLYETNPFVDIIWSQLRMEDRDRFMKHFFSAWMAYRVSIPVENALRLLRAAENDQLSFASGDIAVERLLDHRYGITVNAPSGTRRIAADAVVSAIGTPRAVGQMKSTLISNLLRRGIIQPHRHGGIVVDAPTGLLIGTDGQICSNVSAVGALTSGTYFWTSALEVNARLAARHAHTLGTLLSGARNVERLNSIVA